MGDQPEWTALVLAGGRSSRFGEDKTRATIDGRTLLEHVVGSIPEDVICIVVGPPPPSASRLLVVAIEEEPDGGPVAGIACGIEFVPTPVVVLLAADMPFVSSVVPRLIVELDKNATAIDAVVPIDEAGRRQPLAAAYRTAALRDALASLTPVRGRSMRELLDLLRVSDLQFDGADARLLIDIDTPEDLEQARRTVTGNASDGSEP